jgi:hypothetical protein
MASFFTPGKWYVTLYVRYNGMQVIPEKSLLFCVGKSPNSDFERFLYQDTVVEFLAFSRRGWERLQDDEV